MKRTIENFWLDYWSEILFGGVLLLLTVLSYWLGAFIPERVFECYINQIEYISTSTVCLFGAIILFSLKEQTTLRRSWAIVLLIWGIVDVLIWIMWYVGKIQLIGGTPSDQLFSASVTLGNILAFIFFIYPTQVLRPGWLNWRRAVLLLLPMIVLGVLDYFVPANLLPFIMIYPVIIFLTLCRHVSKYRKWCEDNFSSLEDIDVQWIVRYLTMLAIAGLSFYFIVFWYVPNRMFTQQWMFLLMFAYTTVRVLERPDPWAKVLGDNVQGAKEGSSDEVTATSEHARSKRAIIEAWLEQEKPYLNPNFQLMDLRAVLPMNRTYLSQFINTEYGCSFYRWVNRLRIKETKRLKMEHPEMSTLDIVERCGFSSRQTFYRTFLRETGQSPKEWWYSVQNDPHLGNNS